jgi:hypothetical protein
MSMSEPEKPGMGHVGMGERVDHLRKAAAASLFRRAARSDAIRAIAARAIRPVFAAMPAAERPLLPVFVVGCPRSGTTIVDRALAVSPELASPDIEGHVLWEAFNHPRRHGWSSNALGPEDVTDAERKYVYRLMRMLAGARRYLDKTPKNCLRVLYLDELFPDATFVFVKRRAADNVNSLIEGWRARPRFVSYRVPEPLEGLGELNGHTWSFVLVPGWRDMRGAPLEEICARQYVECNEAMLEAREQLDPAHAIDVAYEDLVERPSDEIGRVFEALGLPFTDKAASFAASLPGNPINSLTPPRRDKWRDQNPAEVSRILPRVSATERRLGY